MGEIFERTVPDMSLDWSGERLTTLTSGQVEIEHLHRYFLARAMCRGCDVLDIAAGEGYGSMLLAQVATSVVGVELSAEAIGFAEAAYRRPNLRFLQGDARSIPLPENAVDVVVSFETIEHFYEQEDFLSEVKRVLRPDGRFIVSSPERDVYSPVGGPVNPYHVRELTREEFVALLTAHFGHISMYAQRPMLGSALVPETPVSGTRPLLTFERRDATHFEASVGLPRPTYLVAVASESPLDDISGSLYLETSGLDGLLSRSAEAEKQKQELTSRLLQADNWHRQLVERNVELADKISELNGETARLRASLEAQNEYRDAVLTSASWRFTAPLRQIGRVDHGARRSRSGRVLRALYRSVAGGTAPASVPANPVDALRDMIPVDATVLVASCGDETLLRSLQRRSWHFPQTDSGLYAGHDPADSTAAIAHLETLRTQGADFFFLPTKVLWWLDGYGAFRRHLSRHYRLVVRQPDAGLLFSLREPPAPDVEPGVVAFDRALAELYSRADDGLAVLDWNTQFDLAKNFPRHTIFSAPDDARVLPYLDHSVDIVAVRDPDRDAVSEARRIARAAVLTFTARASEVGTVVDTEIEWILGSPLPQLPSASIIVAGSADDAALEARLASVCDFLPRDFRGEVLVAAQRASDRALETLFRCQSENVSVRVVNASEREAWLMAESDVLVFLGSDVMPLPDWLPVLLRSLRRYPDAAIIGGRVLAWDGRLAEAGGILTDDGTLQLLGAGNPRPDDPAYGFVREVGWCSRSLLATWRTVFDANGGFDLSYQSSRLQDADYCVRVRKAGGRVYYQPESVVVRLNRRDAGVGQALDRLTAGAR